MTCGPLLLLSLLPLHADHGSSRDGLPQPNAAALVKYLNDNARRIRSLTFTSVSMRASQDGNVGTVEGRLDCQRPRNFHLTGKAVGQPLIDIGSNREEFWAWSSKGDPPYVFHCSYADLPQPHLIPFPCPPDMILAVLGMLEHDPNKSYEVRIKNHTTELIESTKSLDGQPLQMSTVFHSGQVCTGEPVVIGHIFRDAEGKDLCKATITHTQTDPKTGAVVPHRVELAWPEEKIEVTLRLDGPRVNAIDRKSAAKTFSRESLSNLQSFDLARDQPPEATGALIGPGAAAVAGNVIAKATGGNRTAGTVIGAGVGTIAGALAGRVRDEHEKHDLLSELIAILNETKSVDTFSVTLAALAEMGPRAEPAIPAIIRSAERLGLLKDHMLAKEDAESSRRFAETTEALERTIKAILRKEVSTKTRHRSPSTSPASEKKQRRKTDPPLGTHWTPAVVPCVPCVPVTR